MLAATAVLAGCGTTTHGATTSAAISATFTSRSFGYAVSHDSRQLRAEVEQDASGESRMPGIGDVRGDTQGLIVGLKAPANLPESLRGEFQLTAVRAVPILRTPTLAAFRSEAYMRLLQAHGLIVSPAQADTLNGMPAFRTVARDHGVTMLTYVLYRPRFVYYPTWRLQRNAGPWWHEYPMPWRRRSPSRHSCRPASHLPAPRICCAAQVVTGAWQRPFPGLGTRRTHDS